MAASNTFKMISEGGMYCVRHIVTCEIDWVVTSWTYSRKKALKNLWELHTGVKTPKRFYDGLMKGFENTCPPEWK